VFSKLTMAKNKSSNSMNQDKLDKIQQKSTLNININIQTDEN